MNLPSSLDPVQITHLRRIESAVQMAWLLTGVLAMTTLVVLIAHFDASPDNPVDGQFRTAVTAVLLIAMLATTTFALQCRSEIRRQLRLAQLH